MTPTQPTNPAQQIDQTYGPDGLVEEIVHNYPPDGGGTRRWVDAGGEHSEAVTGLSIPAAEQRTVEAKVEEAHVILSEVATLSSPVTPADLADILARAAAALDGGA
jgi:hypothetical protein